MSDGIDGVQDVAVALRNASWGSAAACQLATAGQLPACLASAPPVPGPVAPASSEAAPQLWQLATISFARTLRSAGLRALATEGIHESELGGEGVLLALQCLALQQALLKDEPAAVQHHRGLTCAQQAEVLSGPERLAAALAQLRQARRLRPRPTSEQHAAWRAAHPEGVLDYQPGQSQLGRVLTAAVLSVPGVAIQVRYNHGCGPPCLHGLWLRNLWYMVHIAIVLLRYTIHPLNNVLSVENRVRL